jgi:hypothetical protein
MRRNQADSVATHVLKIVQQNPGVNAARISDLLGIATKQVKNSLAFHRREGRIINRGRAALGASWYPNYDHPENADIPVPDWRDELRSPCRKCGGTETVAIVQIQAEEPEGAIFRALASRSALLCAHCIVGVYQAVEWALMEEIGET